MFIARNLAQTQGESDETRGKDVRCQMLDVSKWGKPRSPFQVPPITQTAIVAKTATEPEGRQWNSGQRHLAGMTFGTLTHSISALQIINQHPLAS